MQIAKENVYNALVELVNDAEWDFDMMIPQVFLVGSCLQCRAKYISAIQCLSMKKNYAN